MGHCLHEVDLILKFLWVKERVNNNLLLYQPKFF